MASLARSSCFGGRSTDRRTEILERQDAYVAIWSRNRDDRIILFEHRGERRSQARAEWQHRRIKALEQEVKSGLLPADQLLAKARDMLDLRRQLAKEMAGERPLT